MRTSGRADAIALSITLDLDARAKARAAEGRDVVNMAVGEPDFAAPAVAGAAASARAESGDVKYTAAAGLPSLREAVAEHLMETRGVPFSPGEVAVCHSAKHALASALLALVDPGDEVLVPLPAWVSYMELIRLAGGVPVLVPPNADYGIDLEALRASVTERTRGVLFNSPNNPSGYVWSRAETEALGALAEERDLFLLSDEIYRRLVYEGDPAVSPTSLSPALRARTVIVDGGSKAFAMTGYRIGFAAAPPAMAQAIVRLNSQVTGAPNTLSQVAYEAVLRKEPPEVEHMCRTFAERRDVLLGELAALGLSGPEPRGAFYAFPDLGAHLDERGSVGFCEELLEAEDLVLVPGDAFGMDAHVRLSYALPVERLREATLRLGRFLRSRAARRATGRSRSW